MRISVSLAALWLAACGQEATPPVVPVGNEPNVIEPGLWSVNRSILSQQVGEQRTTMAIEASPTAETKCLTEPVGKTEAIEFLLDTEGAECRPVKTDVGDGKVDVTASCVPPPNYQENVLAAEGDYSTGRFGLTLTQTLRAVPPGQDSETRLAVDGRRAGDC